LQNDLHASWWFGPAGVVTVWDLERRKLHAVVGDAHDAGVVALHFFAGEQASARLL
jgi:hypothetical protein